MPNDEWLEDVRRWYYGGNPPAAEAAEDAGVAAPAEVGYEAAHPALQARHWPDAATVRGEPRPV